MRAAWLVILVLAGAAQAQQKPFDLKGDVLGESIATFKARHPQANCGRHSDTISYCEQQRDVTFAGLKHTNLKMNGMYAGFSEDKMVQLSYFVDGGNTAYNIVVQALAARFGEPSAEHDAGPNFHSTTWERPLMIVTVSHYVRGGVDISLSVDDDKTRSEF